MSERVPPKLASWLLRRCGSPFHGESLEGDLFEQYQEGRSRAWYWRQVTAVMWIAGGRLLRTLPWTGTARVLSREIAGGAAILAAITVADRARRTHSFGEMMSPAFACILTVLICVGVAGLLIWILTARRRQGRGIGAEMLAFGAVALSAGALTWANAACACQLH
ncbi:MAG TPA: hypothetical protein VNV61_00570 [Steroidobacteraceae bacterium]|jgi:hypothetical protein|nr:hypothetical protein [Steroidobacteraceae bacterium]